jgi:hypothetical protein
VQSTTGRQSALQRHRIAAGFTVPGQQPTALALPGAHREGVMMMLPTCRGRDGQRLSFQLLKGAKWPAHRRCRKQRRQAHQRAARADSATGQLPCNGGAV